MTVEQQLSPRLGRNPGSVRTSAPGRRRAAPLALLAARCCLPGEALLASRRILSYAFGNRSNKFLCVYFCILSKNKHYCGVGLSLC
jgi:hypothetical protein